MATATRTPPVFRPAAQPEPPAAAAAIHRFTLEQFQEMIRSGLLREDDRVELLNGWIVDKMPPNPPHAQTVRQLSRRLSAVVEPVWVLSTQNPVTVAGSQPEPDVAVAAGPESRYDGRHPADKDITLVVEVADSSLAEDRTVKLAIYAAAKLPAYWIVNIPDRQVEVYTRPRGGKSPTYRARTDYGPADAVPVVLAGTQVGTIPVREVLPR